MSKLRTLPATVWSVPLLVIVLNLFVACGEDGDGNNDTLFTGLSGVIILAVVIWILVRVVRKNDGGDT